MALQEWIVAELAQVDEPGALEFSVGDDDWPFKGFVVRWRGEIYAYANSCAHAGHPLNLKPDGFFDPQRKFLLCSSHGALFEPQTGACVAGPCAGARLRKLDCYIKKDEIVVRAPRSMRY